MTGPQKHAESKHRRENLRRFDLKTTGFWKETKVVQQIIFKLQKKWAAIFSEAIGSGVWLGRKNVFVSSQKLGDKNAWFFWTTLEHPGWLLFLCMARYGNMYIFNLTYLC